MNDDRLNKIALSKGVVAAEAVALRSDKRPVSVTAEGLLGVDRKHLLVRGSRTFNGIVKGAVFFDPIMSEVVAVQPDRGGISIFVGLLDVEELLTRRGPWNRVLVDAVGYASEAPDRGVEGVSHWLVRRVVEAAREALERTDLSSARSWTVAADPASVWEALGESWVVQPWGIPLPPEALGALV